MSSTEGRATMAEAAHGERAEEGPGPNAIEASRVVGTAVFNIEGDHLGHIHDLVIGKQDGRIRYAVMAFGGFLGLGEEHHPLPWTMLKYDVRQGGYVVGITSDQLQGAPRHAAGAPVWNDPGYGDSVDDYWKPATA